MDSASIFSRLEITKNPSHMFEMNIQICSPDKGIPRFALLTDGNGNILHSWCCLSYMSIHTKMLDTFSPTGFVLVASSDQTKIVECEECLCLERPGIQWEE